MGSLAPISAEPLCRYLDWDSEFFGVRIGRVTGSRLSPEHVAEILAWSRQQALDCLYLLADPDPPTVSLAEENRFRMVDLRVTLETSVSCPAAAANAWEGDGIRRSTAQDIPVLRALAASAHTDSRFYQDIRFPRSRCDELYGTWIEKSCQGYADMVLVAEHRGRPAGYLTCHLRHAHQAHIGLVGIAPEARNLGLGSRLIQHGLYWLSGQHVQHVSVATQGRNTRAIRLYERNGFLTSALQLWYHLWFSPATAGGQHSRGGPL